MNGFGGDLRSGSLSLESGYYGGIGERERETSVHIHVGVRSFKGCFWGHGMSTYTPYNTIRTKGGIYICVDQQALTEC